ncbi:urease accessory protein UreD [Hydrogenophaga sp.]|uniref:urease accessory protein UreD n=1 Tax=Hydrogenophaga sp. TaxID=1904254 RepID=UPI0025BADCC7|nr:urease accessory protein UreD [Hydrogenophaga sp.]
MAWQAHLELHHQRQGDRTVVRHLHNGPLRILKSLYPEGEAICHNVIVHPPGGLVGGDELDIRVRVDEGAHALVSTPGATRFYASDELQASQRVSIDLAAGARLEWLPLETLAYPGCQALNQLRFTLAPSAEMMAWDVTALGLPSADQAFTHGRFQQHLEMPGLWLEQAHLDGSDQRLMNSPLGLGGQRCLGSLLLVTGYAMGRERREGLLEAARLALQSAPAGVRWGVTYPQPQLLVVRAVAPLVEPLMASLQSAWAALRHAAWGLVPTAPRIWRV